MTETTKEPLFAKLKRKTVNAGHTTKLGAYKTKKAAQIQLLRNKVLDRKKRYGVEYMDLIEDKATPQVLRKCIEDCLKDPVTDENGLRDGKATDSPKHLAY